MQYPASDPLVLSVGGTTVGNVSGSSFDEYVSNGTTSSDGVQPCRRNRGRRERFLHLDVHLRE